MTHDLSRFFAPRWTWRSTLLAGAVSLGLYLLLPYLETLSTPPGKSVSLRSVTTATLPPPPARPKPAEVEKPRPPQPELQQLRRRLAPLQAALQLGTAIGDVGGDFNLDFAISADALADQVKQMVFEIGDLDSPPRPLARLQPLYPPQARMRRIEGFVVVEFVITAAGAPKDIVVVSSRPGDIFVSSAIRAIERWRFAPGTKDGQAVTTRVRQKVAFKLY